MNPFWIFCRNLWHGSQNSIYVSRVKIAEELVFLFFISEFLRDLSKKKFRLLAKKLQEIVKTSFRVCRWTIFGLKFFQKFWTVLDFLQKPLAWFSNVHLRVQSKNCGRNTFLFFFSDFFSEFERKIFQTFGQKLQEVFKTTFYVSRGTFCGLDFFLKFESFWIFCRNLWHGSQNSIYVFRVNTAEEIVFLFFFSGIFRMLSEIFFRLLAKKLQEVVKTTFCVSRRTIFGLKKLIKVLNRFSFSAKTFGMVLKILSTCPEWNFRKKQFF